MHQFTPGHFLWLKQDIFETSKESRTTIPEEQIVPEVAVLCADKKI
jgi:hypothetical protein